MRKTLILACLVAVFATYALSLSANGRKFYPDDPVMKELDTQDASKVEPYEIGLMYDTLENLFYRPGDKTTNVRAQNINTIDEVPDSAWYTNRAGSRPLSVEELLKGPDASTGPAPGAWTVIAAKSDGVTPGFTIRDSAGTMWFIKVDPPGYIGMATGTEVVVTKLLWALGYHVAENYIAILDRNNLVVAEDAMFRPRGGGDRRRMRESDVDASLRRAARLPDGTYRVIASKAIAGKPIGPFRFYGTRPDDPNDFIPHEHRRELRGYGVFAAWLNHVDSKSINTYDSVVTEDGRSFLKHHLLDYGSTIGSAGVYPREPFEGWEYLVEPGQTARGIPSLGFYIRPWRTIPIYRARSVGAFPSDNTQWDPERWKPRYANAAFLASRADDKFWAATKLQGITPELLAAVVKVGQFNDPASEEMVVKFLVERRAAILRRHFTSVNPIVNPRLDGSGLTFENAAVAANVAPAPAGYTAAWFRYDNDAGSTSPLGETNSTGTSIPAPSGLPATAGSYIKVEVAATKGADDSWSKPVHVYFRHQDGGWKLVGLERMPEGNAPLSAPGSKPVAATS